VQNKVRGDLIGALQVVNNELQKVIDRWQTAPAPAEAGTAETSTPADIDTGAASTGLPSSDFSQPAPDEANVTGFEDKPHEQV
jgi:hypothetical protein